MNTGKIRSFFVNKNAFKQSLRIIIPLYATYILFLLSIFLVFVPMEKKHMISQKKELIRELTKSTLNMLEGYEQRINSGELTLDEAQKKAVQRIRNLRYGLEGKDYFWIINMQNKAVMHPYLPELEGTDLSTYADSNGTFLFTDMVDTVKTKGSGYVEYIWQKADDSTRATPKISFVEGFPAWGWILGTGVYIEDINRDILGMTRGFVKIFIGVLVIVTVISLYIALRVVKIEKQKSIAEKAKRLDELRLIKLLELTRMSDASMKDLTGFALEEAIELTQSDIGYIAFLNKDETHLTMHTWSKHTMKQCGIEDKTMVYPVGETGQWGEAARLRKPVVVNDYETADIFPKKGYPDGHVKILRHMNIPVFEGKKIVAVAGVGNKAENYDDSDVRQLQLMMDGMWHIIQKNQDQENLRESEKRYRLLADNATDNIWIMRLSDLSFIYISPSVEKILGYTPDEIIAMDMNQYVAEDSLDKIFTVISEELALHEKNGRDPKRYRAVEVKQIKKNGTEVWTEITASFLLDKNGVPDRVLGITRNIDERKQMEEKLRQSQKMEALGTLAGGIAHDFNNILSSVLGFTELAKLGCNNNQQVIDDLDQVIIAGLRARDLVKHILTFSRKADVRKHFIPITPLVKESIKFIRASTPANIEIKHNFDLSENLIFADPAQIHQIFMNIFTNATHAMKEQGGILDIHLKSIRIHAGDLSQEKELEPGEYLRIIISDTGCGIPKKTIGRIFEPFFTTKKRGEGTGMGMSTVFGIIKDMNGFISVYSEPGTGTTFQILIPEHEEEPVEEESFKAPPSGGNGRILLLDDEEPIIKWSQQILQKLGYEVISTTDSLKALEKFRQDPDDFDLVLTDVAMPKMTGLEISKKIAAMRPDIPIVLCTGFSEGLTSENLKDYGVSDMIMKPVIASELAVIIKRNINKEA